MSTVKIAVVAAVLAGLIDLLACRENNRDGQQVSASKAAAATQSTAQKPNEKPDADEGEEGPVPGKVAPEKPAPQQSPGKQDRTGLPSSASRDPAGTHTSQILFVCEHGNVKSLMAASYFNQLAQERGLPVRAVARGSAPNSTTVPPAIVRGLRGDGFDVSAFHPSAVSASDVSASQLVITIGTALPLDTQTAQLKLEQWNDVPPASVDYGGSRDSLKSHIKDLVEQLAHP